MKLSPETTNVLFVTLDSCRYDTASLASTPQLDQISPLKEAETSGSYTYPAHHAFFLGDLPRLKSPHEFFPGISQVWRSSGARKLAQDDTILFRFDAKHIIDHYQALGHHVHGYGGVGFFNTFNPNNLLPSFFNHFTFFGDPKNLPPDRRLPRSPQTFPLENISAISQDIAKEPYFVFINSIATHIPYDTPETTVDEPFKQLISRTFKEHASKQLHEDELPFSPEEIWFLKMLQITALEWVDKQLGLLLDALPKSFPTVAIICADHGEEFGDHGRFGHAHPDETVMTVPLWSGLLMPE